MVSNEKLAAIKFLYLTWNSRITSDANKLKCFKLRILIRLSQVWAEEKELKNGT